MKELLYKYFGWEFSRDNNYYFGLILLQLGISSIVFYLVFDAFEPLSFLITFLVCGWGFVLLWKSDNDYRFQQAAAKLSELESALKKDQRRAALARMSGRYRRFSKI